MNEIVEKALEKVNEIRLTFDLPPMEQFPKGRKNDGYQCPVARSLLPGTHVEEGTINFPHRIAGLSYEARDYMETPREVREFIARFDQGFYPELVESPPTSNEESDVE